MAGTLLPAEVRALGLAGNSGALSVTPIDVQSTDEIGQVARAVDRVHQEAVRLAGEEARLRGSVSAIFVSVLRRSNALLERLLRLIDSAELGEDDPERLASLFQMDHLATRMRRKSDSAARSRGPRGTTPLDRAGHPGGRGSGRVVRDRAVRPGHAQRPARCLGQPGPRCGRHRAPARRTAGQRHYVLGRADPGNRVRAGGARRGSLITITDRGMGMPRSN